MRGQERMFGLLGGQIGSHRDLTMADEKERSMKKNDRKQKGGPPRREPARSKNSASQPRLVQPGRRPTAAPTTACFPEGKRRHAPTEGENRSSVVCQTAEHVAARTLHTQRLLPIRRMPARSSGERPAGKRRLGRRQVGSSLSPRSPRTSSPLPVRPPAVRPPAVRPRTDRIRCTPLTGSAAARGASATSFPPPPGPVQPRQLFSVAFGEQRVVTGSTSTERALK